MFRRKKYSLLSFVSKKTVYLHEECKKMLGQFIINGLITGILYSLLAIGFALVYNTTKIFHIAAAGIYVFAAYMFWLFVAKAELSIIPASLVAIVLTMLLSLLSELLIYRPLKKRKPLLVWQ